jgi:hypothetical protein
MKVNLVSRSLQMMSSRKLEIFVVRDGGILVDELEFMKNKANY